MSIEEQTSPDSSASTPEPAPVTPPPGGQIPGADKKLLCGLLGIFIGWTGAHKFVLGYTKEGIIQIILNIACGLGGLLGLIEGIIYLTKTDQEFVDTYVNNQRGWF